MGFTRCWAPGCPSKVGDKLILRGLPKNDSLRTEWLNSIPNSENLLPSAAICELHFRPECFERIRQDGKRKLETCAVPTVFKTICELPSNVPPSKKRVLRQITQRSDHSYVRPQTVTSDSTKERTSLCALPCSTPQRPMLSLRQLPLDLSPILGSSTEPLSWGSENTTLTTDFLKERNSPNSTPCSTPLKPTPSFQPEPLDRANISEIRRLEKIVELQRNEIARMVNEERAKEAKIRVLQNTLARSTAVKRKYEIERACNRKLEAKLSGRSIAFPSLRMDQLEALRRGKAQGVKWSAESVREGLVFKMRCGSSGYGAFVQRYPILPSVRCLQSHVQFIKFESGILEDMLYLVEAAVPSMNEFEKACSVVLDEMAIKEGERFDPSTKRWVGMSTLASHGGRASKALVIMLAGLTRRWKVIAGYYFTRSQSAEAKQQTNATGNAMSEIITSVISRSEKIGLNVFAVVSDMGPDNLAFWRKFNTTGNRKNTQVTCSFPNPQREGSEVFVLPDSPHLFKSIKKMFEVNRVMKLPASIALEERLPSDIVDYGHIEDLLKHESKYELRVAYRLKKSNVHVKDHFPKMNMSTTRAVICHRTGEGLNLLAEERKNKVYLTTAWFVMLLSTFFQLTNSRHRGLALSMADPSSYKKALDLIRKVSYLFRNMAVGSGGTWKPAQRGMLVLCEALLRIQQHFLQEKGYSYLLLGHLTSDCIENLFSLIRLGQPVPHALAFVQNLKVIALSMYHTCVKGSNYDFEEGEYLVDPLTVAKQKAALRSTLLAHKAKLETSSTPVHQMVCNICYTFQSV